MGNGTNDGAVHVSVKVGTVERKEKYQGPYEVTLEQRDQLLKTGGFEMSDDIRVKISDSYVAPSNYNLTATADKVLRGYRALGKDGNFVLGELVPPTMPVKQFRDGSGITIDSACGAFSSTTDLESILYDDSSSSEVILKGGCVLFPMSKVTAINLTLPSLDAFIFGMLPNLEYFESDTAKTAQYYPAASTGSEAKTVIMPECSEATDQFAMKNIHCMRLGKLEHITNSSFYHGRYSFADKTVDGKDLCSVLDIGCADYSGNGGGTLTVDNGASFPTGMDIIVYRYAKEPIIGTGGTGSLEDAVKSGAELYVPNGRYTYFAYEKYPAARSRIHMLSDYDANSRNQYGY